MPKLTLDLSNPKIVKVFNMYQKARGRQSQLPVNVSNLEIDDLEYSQFQVKKVNNGVVNNFLENYNPFRFAGPRPGFNVDQSVDMNFNRPIDNLDGDLQEAYEQMKAYFNLKKEDMISYYRDDKIIDHRYLVIRYAYHFFEKIAAANNNNEKTRLLKQFYTFLDDVYSDSELTVTNRSPSQGQSLSQTAAEDLLKIDEALKALKDHKKRLIFSDNMEVLESKNIESLIRKVDKALLLFLMPNTSIPENFLSNLDKLLDAFIKEGLDFKDFKKWVQNKQVKNEISNKEAEIILKYEGVITSYIVQRTEIARLCQEYASASGDRKQEIKSKLDLLTNSENQPGVENLKLEVGIPGFLNFWYSSKVNYTDEQYEALNNLLDIRNKLLKSKLSIERIQGLKEDLGRLQTLLIPQAITQTLQDLQENLVELKKDLKNLDKQLKTLSSQQGKVNKSSWLRNTRDLFKGIKKEIIDQAKTLKQAAKTIVDLTSVKNTNEMLENIQKDLNELSNLSELLFSKTVSNEIKIEIETAKNNIPKSGNKNVPEFDKSIHIEKHILNETSVRSFE